MLTDQSEWAVCGRSAGVMNMDTAKKQTVVVEVMALVGGHLLLPKVKLSKYIPADHHTSHQGHTDEPSPRVHLAASTQINASPNDTRSSQAVTKDDNKSVLVTSSNEKTSSVGGKKMRFIFSNSMFDFGHLANSAKVAVDNTI